MKGGWRLEAIGPNRTRATTTIRVETRFWPLRAMMERFVLRPQLDKSVAIGQAQFKAFVERGLEAVPLSKAS